MALVPFCFLDLISRGGKEDGFYLSVLRYVSVGLPLWRMAHVGSLLFQFGDASNDGVALFSCEEHGTHHVAHIGIAPHLDASALVVERGVTT